MPDESVRKKAADLTRGATTPVEKTRRLYDFVARNIRYVSLSFGVGRLQPHAASEVLQNGYGDCKAAVSCDASGCAAVFEPLEGLQSNASSSTSAR
jgi:transglutaminase-like putative cysteine protease